MNRRPWLAATATPVPLGSIAIQSTDGNTPSWRAAPPLVGRAWTAVPRWFGPSERVTAKPRAGSTSSAPVVDGPTSGTADSRSTTFVAGSTRRNVQALTVPSPCASRRRRASSTSKPCSTAPCGTTVRVTRPPRVSTTNDSVGPACSGRLIRARRWPSADQTASEIAVNGSSTCHRSAPSAISTASTRSCWPSVGRIATAIVPPGSMVHVCPRSASGRVAIRRGRLWPSSRRSTSAEPSASRIS